MNAAACYSLKSCWSTSSFLECLNRYAEALTSTKIRSFKHGPVSLGGGGGDISRYSTVHVQCMVTTSTPHVQCMVTTHTWNVNGVRPSDPSIGRALRGGGQQPNTVLFKLRQLHLHLVTGVEDNLPPFVLLQVLRGQPLHEPYLHRHALQEVILPAPPILRLLPLQDEFFGLLQVSQLLLREVVPLAVVM